MRVKTISSLLLCVGLLMACFAAPALAAKRGNAADFEGAWDTVVPESNAHYTLYLHVDGTTVTGNFVNLEDGQYNGTITGTVDPSLDGTASGGRLDYDYVQPKAEGSGGGYFIVGDDDTIAGFTHVEGSSQKVGWEGKRVKQKGAKRGNAQDFHGIWSTKMGDVDTFNVTLTLRVDGDTVTGELVNRDGVFNGKLTGTVDPSLDGTPSGGRLDFQLFLPAPQVSGEGYLIVGNNGTIAGFTTFETTGNKKLNWEGRRKSKIVPDVVDDDETSKDDDPPQDDDDASQAQVKIAVEVTGYDAPDGSDKCYLHEGDTASVLGMDEGNPIWMHLKGPDVCKGKDFWVYAELGVLEDL